MSGPLHTQLCEKLGIEYPVVAFTHCKDVAVAVINAGGFAVLGEAMHTPMKSLPTSSGFATASVASPSASTWCCPPPCPKKRRWNNCWK